MSDAVEELIKEIAAKHGIAVGRDDPILILQTINARLLDDGAKAQRALLQEHKEELEGITQRWSVDVKGKAERILTASLTASKEAMTRMMQDGATMMTAAVRGEVDQALKGIEKLAARKLRDKEPELADAWDELREAQRLHQLHQRRIAQDKKQALEKDQRLTQGGGQSLCLAQTRS